MTYEIVEAKDEGFRADAGRQEVVARAKRSY